MGDHYFSATPSVLSRPTSVQLRLPDVQFNLTGDRGVFSGERVDPGTMALLKESRLPPPCGNLLDLGCGYGPIACTLARRAPGATVWALDVNSRARELTAANALALGLANVNTVGPEDIPAGTTFEGIWSNPPIRIGKSALYELLLTWLARLAETAQAWLVVNRHLGGDSLAGFLSTAGWRVYRTASKSGYRVLEISHRPVAGEIASQARPVRHDQ
jgi:16S rRNA (guanine1207-N2)-methyltransferase